MEIRENKKYYTIEISNRSPKKYLERDLKRPKESSRFSNWGFS
jgi:hypothetical protein